MKKIVLLMLMMAFNTLSFADSWIEKDRTTETKEGLFEIRQEAITFINHYNAEHNTQLAVDEINAKIIVPRCLVPLKSEWANKSDGRSKKEIRVSCHHSISKNQANWKVFISVKNNIH